MKKLLSHRPGQLLLSAIFLIVYAIGAYYVDKSDTATHWWSDMFWTAAALIAGLRCLATAQGEQKNIRQAWMLIGYACLAWFAGMLVWDYLELFANQPVPFPGLSDLGFILFAPLLMAGIIAYRSEVESAQLTLKQISELGLILSAIIFTLIVVLYQPIRDLKEPSLYLLTALAYPVLYMGVFFFGLTTPFIRPSRDKRHVMILLLIGVGIHAFTDTFYSFSLLGKNYAVGNYLDIFWLFGFTVIYWAAFEQSLATKKISDTRIDRLELISHKIEAVLPALILLWIGIIFIFFGRDLDEEIYIFLSPTVFMIAIFLAMLGWSGHQIQQNLYYDLLLSKQSLANSYTELEKRVIERTQALHLSKEQAEQANKAKTNFLSSMSHELRTPLNGILGFAQLLKLDEKDLSELHNQNIDEIITSGNHLLTLINEILDLQTIESGKMILDIKTLDIGSIIEEGIRIIGPFANERNIEIEIKPCKTKTSALVDRIKLKQALVNLISNAVKYNNKGGQVLIECGDHSDDEIVINITDNGHGITQHEQENIFAPFVRVGKDNVEGTGIGLTVTKEIIKAMGGRIELSSKPGKGSTFSVFLKK